MLILSNIRLLTVFSIILVHTISWTMESFNYSLHWDSHLLMPPVLTVLLWIFSTIPLMSGVYLYNSDANADFDDPASKKKWLVRIIKLGLILYSLDILKNIIFYGLSGFFYTEVLNMIGASYILIALTAYFSTYLTLLVGFFIFALSFSKYKSDFHVEILNAYLKNYTDTPYIHYTLGSIAILAFLYFFNKIKNSELPKIFKRNLFVLLTLVMAWLLLRVGRLDVNDKNLHLSYVYYFKNLFWGSYTLNYSFWPLAPWASQVLIGYSVVSIFNKFKLTLTSKLKYMLGLLGCMVLIAPTYYTYQNFQPLAQEYDKQHFLWSLGFFNSGALLVICGIGTTLLLCGFMDQFRINLINTDFTRSFNKSILWIYLFVTTIARRICHLTTQVVAFEVGLVLNIFIVVSLSMLIAYVLNTKKLSITLKKINYEL